MIVAASSPISVADEKVLRKWLTDPAGDLLIRCLKAEEALLQIQLISDLSKVANDLSKGEPIPSASHPTIRQISILSSTIKVIEDKMKEGSNLITITPSIE